MAEGLESPSAVIGADAAGADPPNGRLGIRQCIATWLTTAPPDGTSLINRSAVALDRVKT